MKKPHELKKQAEAKAKEAKGITDLALKEDRDLTDDERVQVDSLTAESKQLIEDAKAIEADAKRRADIDGVVSMFDVPAGTAADSPDEDTPDVDVKEPEWLKDPALGWKSHTDFFMAIIRARTTKGQVFPPNLKHLSVDGVKAGERKRQQLIDEGKLITATAGSDEHARFADPYGGFFIPESTLPGLKMTPSEGDVLGRFLGRLPMQTATVKINARSDKTHTTSVTGGIIVYRRAEADTVTATRMATEQVVYSATPLMGKAYATNELLRDSPISFAALLSGAFGDAFTDRLMRERLTGTGAGEFEGISNAPCKIEVSAETGQDAATFVFENAVKMLARVWRMNSAVWLMNRTVLPQLPLLNVTVGQGGTAVFTTDATSPIPMRLFGLPIIFTEYCAALGTAGDIYLINGSEYLEGTWQPMQGLSSIHVRFENNETTFKFFMENDARCWWRSAITPVNGDSMSPIISLAARAAA